MTRMSFKTWDFKINFEEILELFLCFIFSVCPSHRCRLKMSLPNTSSSGREGNRRQVWKERQTWLDHESRLQHRHRPIPVHYSSGSSWRRQLVDSTQNKPHVTTVHVQTMSGQLAIFMSSNLLIYFVLTK